MRVLLYRNRLEVKRRLASDEALLTVWKDRQIKLPVVLLGVGALPRDNWYESR